MVMSMTDTSGAERVRPLLQNHQALRAARLSEGMSVRSLAEAAGVSVSLAREAEKGNCGLSDETLNRIAAALGRPVAALANPDAVGGQAVIDLMDKDAPAAGGEAREEEPGRQPDAA
jgi:transcriptional regulator with XRE-family HTH domain